MIIDTQIKTEIKFDQELSDKHKGKFGVHLGSSRIL